MWSAAEPAGADAAGPVPLQVSWSSIASLRRLPFPKSFVDAKSIELAEERQLPRLADALVTQGKILGEPQALYISVEPRIGLRAASWAKFA